MRIVEIALYRAYVDIFALLRRHLKFLYVGNTVFGVKDHYFYTVNVLVTFKRGFARIARGRNEYESRSFFSRLFERRGKQTRHYLKCHVLKSARRTVPEFKHFMRFVKTLYGRGVFAETLFLVCVGRRREQFVVGVICQIKRKYVSRTVRVILFRKFFDEIF